MLPAAYRLVACLILTNSLAEIDFLKGLLHEI